MSKTQAVEGLKTKFQPHIGQTQADGTQNSYISIHDKKELEGKEIKNPAEQVLHNLFEQNPDCDFIAVFKSGIMDKNAHERTIYNFKKAGFRSLTSGFWGL